jgi:hypothetical protein
MMMAASENNALGKNNELFYVYPTISKVQEPHFRHHIIMGQHSKVFPNHYLTEHML